MESQNETHWWYQARRKLLEMGIKDYAASQSNLRILDLASACGGNFQMCNQYGTIIGIDISPHSIRFCKEKGIDSMVQGNVELLPFEEKSFDVVVAFDIFEHLPNDIDSMKEVFRILKDDGILLVNVPAFMSLYSEHDVAFEHVRRYSKKELIAKLKSVNFKPVFSSFWSFFIFPAVFLIRKIFVKKRLEESQSDFHLDVPNWIEMTLRWLSILEVSWIFKKNHFPFGVSFYCVATK